MNNYTVADLLRIFAGLILFLPFAFFPGYVIGWLSDAFAFRSRSLQEKALIGIVLSTSTVPSLIYLTARLGSMVLTWSMVGAAAAGFAVLSIKDWRREPEPLAGTGRAMLIALCWVIVGSLVLVDLHWGNQLYIAASSFDYAVRNEIVGAITRSGVEAVNPFFFPGSFVPLRYHHFWFLACSMVNNLSQGWVGPGQAIMAGTIWCGLALMACVILFAWYFRNIEGIHSRRRSFTGVALLCVMGLDILPVLLLMCGGIVHFTVDKWNEDLVGWIGSLLWAPHYVAGTIACLTGYLVLWTASRRAKPAKIGAIVVAGTAFSCAAGSAIYVALVFAAALVVLAAISIWKRWYWDAIVIWASGTLAIILSLPYLATLIGEKQSPEAGLQFINLTVRPFLHIDLVLHAFQTHEFIIAGVNILLLPLNYGLELGLLFLVGLIQLRRYRSRRAGLGRREWAEIVLVLVPVFICTFFRSSVINNNDLGWRGFLIAQFILLLWAIDYVRFGLRRSKHAMGVLGRRTEAMAALRWWIMAFFWLGLAGTAYGVAINRFYVPGIDAGWIQVKNWLVPDRMSGLRTLALRETYEWVSQNVPAQGILLENPEQLDLSYGLYANRQTVAADMGCGTSFGGSLEKCRTVLPLILPVFTKHSEKPPDIESLCRLYSIRMIIVKDTDSVWQDPRSWMLDRRPVYSNRFSKVFACASL